MNFFSNKNDNYKQCNINDYDTKLDIENENDNKNFVYPIFSSQNQQTINLKNILQFNFYNRSKNIVTNKLIICNTDDYIDFLNNKRPTSNGKMYLEIINYNEDELENDHGFIQWIFPLTEPSNYATDVPIIDIEQLQKHIMEDPTIVDKLIVSYNMMIKHWGLDGDLTTKNEKTLKLNGHDALRLSRMLQSLIFHNKSGLAITTYEKVVQYIKNNFLDLNPLMYYGNNLESMKTVGHLHDIKKINVLTFDKDLVCVDVWRYHLSKAHYEFEDYKNKSKEKVYSNVKPK